MGIDAGIPIGRGGDLPRDRVIEGGATRGRMRRDRGERGVP